MKNQLVLSKKRRALFKFIQKNARAQRKLWLKRYTKYLRIYKRSFRKYSKFLKHQKYYQKIVTIRTALVAGSILVTFGLVIVAISLVNTWQAEQAAARSGMFSGSPIVKSEKPVISGAPIRIQVPEVGIDLKVVPGEYFPKTQSWTLSLNDAHYGVMTAPPNDTAGLTFIYAHYRKGVFLKLPKVKPGATALITTDNGHVFSYTFRESRETSPNDTSLFSYQGKPILVLQTCSGLWQQNRQLFTFDLMEVS